MAEQHTLTTPISPSSITGYRIARMVLDWDAAILDIVIVDTAGTRQECRYSGSAATTLMTALNKANLSTKSLQKRALEQLVADGKLGSGSVTGTPD